MAPQGSIDSDMLECQNISSLNSTIEEGNSLHHGDHCSMETW
jgi:hypothetical protein